MKLIEVVADPGDLDTMASFLTDEFDGLECWHSEMAEDQRQSVRMLVDDSQRQAVLDRLQDLLATTSNARIVVIPVEAVLPRIDVPEVPPNGKAPSSKKSSGSTREEIYNQIEKGARLATFLSWWCCRQWSQLLACWKTTLPWSLARW